MGVLKPPFKNLDMFDMYKKFLKQDPNNWKWLIAIHVVVYSIMLILMLDF